MLIFRNATIQYANRSDGELVYSSPIECYIETLAEGKRGRDEGSRYESYSYSVMINASSVEGIFEPVSAIITINWNNKEIPPMIVQRVEYYPLTQTYQLWM